MVSRDLRLINIPFIVFCQYVPKTERKSTVVTGSPWDRMVY